MKANEIFAALGAKKEKVMQQANRMKVSGEKKSEMLKQQFQLKYADVLDMLRDNFSAQGSH